MSANHSYFEDRQMLLGLAATLWTLLLILSHWQLPEAWVWGVAAVFSVLMNATYLIEAAARRAFLASEARVAAALVLLSVLGALVWPPFVIAAVFGHAAWDLAKHYGAGVPFLSWYIWGCAAIDLCYATALLVYWLG